MRRSAPLAAQIGSGPFVVAHSLRRVVDDRGGVLSMPAGVDGTRGSKQTRTTTWGRGAPCGASCGLHGCKPPCFQMIGKSWLGSRKPKTFLGAPLIGGAKHLTAFWIFVLLCQYISITLCDHPPSQSAEAYCYGGQVFRDFYALLPAYGWIGLLRAKALLQGRRR